MPCAILGERGSGLRHLSEYLSLVRTAGTATSSNYRKSPSNVNDAQ